MLDAFAVVDDDELFSFLAGTHGRSIDRDTRNRFFGLIDKCPEWEDSSAVVVEVTLDSHLSMALSIGYALTCALNGHGVACLVFGGCERRGFITVCSTVGTADVFFTASAQLKLFWRSLYELENVAESEFFALARTAFPDLVFSPALVFRSFEGTYPALRSHVVRHLAVLNDDFLSAYRAAKGIPRDVEMNLADAGCPGISPESPRTRASAKAMREREIEYEGRMIRCDWHTKIEPHRNRIHFAFGESFGGKVFIGIFTSHLTT